ncbi:MAG: methionyl-tRNA formyltransferase [Lachnospiraceae bacterium]|nr:methionyl-tRNA formyltransferase [Lachnospiraceae bacterium]
MRIVYMGTPEFAVAPLKELIAAGHEIVGVVTQRDKPKGRSGKMLPPPVKEEALKHGIEVFQPERMRDRESIEWLKDKLPDAVVVAAYGQILTSEVLETPRYGCLNIHASLLPRWRGASPIQQAVIEGDKESGVTIMLMDEGIDTGDILLTERVAIEPYDTADSLGKKLSLIGGPLIVRALEMIKNGDITRISQTGESTYARMIHKKMGLIDFDRPADATERLVRGMNPWPSAFTYIDGKMLKIWKCFVEKDESLVSEGVDISAYNNGDIVKISGEYIYIKTGKNILVISELQPEGKKRMETSAFLRGSRLETGMKLGIGI